MPEGKPEFKFEVDIVSHLLWEYTTEQLVQFVKELDVQAGEWDFTEALYKYFKKEHKRRKKAMGE